MYPPVYAFDSVKVWEQFLRQGTGDQWGGSIFVGVRPYNQRGGSFWSGLRSLFRFVAPTLKSAGKTIGKELLRAGIDTAADVVKGDVPLGESLKTHGRSAAGRLIETASNAYKAQTGSGRKRRRKHRTTKRKHTTRKQQGGRFKRSKLKRLNKKLSKKLKSVFG